MKVNNESLLKESEVAASEKRERRWIFLKL